MSTSSSSSFSPPPPSPSLLSALNDSSSESDVESALAEFFVTICYKPNQQAKQLAAYFKKAEINGHRLLLMDKDQMAGFFFRRQIPDGLAIELHAALHPPSASSSSSSSADFQKFAMDIEKIKSGQEEIKSGHKRVLEKFERPSIAMSSAGSDKNWSIIVGRNGLAIDPNVLWPDKVLGSDSDEKTPPAFQWDDSNENQQHVRYMPYLNQYLGISSTRFTLQREQQLAVVDDHRLPFDLKGTVDVAVIDKDIFLNSYNAAMGVVAALELKKNPDERAFRQAVAYLIAADCHSNLRPFAVLTDLRDEWRFMWIDGRTVKVVRPPAATARRDAFRLFRYLLAASNPIHPDEQAKAVLDALPFHISKRAKLSTIKEERRSKDESEDDDETDVNSNDEYGADGSGWDEEDKQMLRIRMTRRLMKNTPWLREFVEPEWLHRAKSSARHMPDDATNMFS